MSHPVREQIYKLIREHFPEGTANLIYDYWNDPSYVVYDFLPNYLTKQERKTGRWKTDPTRICMNKHEKHYSQYGKIVRKSFEYLDTAGKVKLEFYY